MRSVLLDSVRVFRLQRPAFSASIQISPMALCDVVLVIALLPAFSAFCSDFSRDALSVIPTGSWGDVARRFTMIRWVSPKL
ncbi:hypothetical protein F511_10173 [Dorcoceras hygrometricum]|uniref:Uncharacterized protein n=1 Tax=Dorcoceras hygrometricum TaxID=472368 RepID=A0A2Z7B1H4_9LAMI|nr:hypothetical protein F511_10173 [Dorcoceras hygrometricum]